MVIAFGSPAIDWGRGSSPAARLPLPVLGELDREAILSEATAVESRGPFRLWQAGSLVAGVASFPVELAQYAEQARDAYMALFESLGEARLYRIWNYSPYINEGEGDEEGYRRFCQGRAAAFEERFGADAIEAIPAGSCLGSDGNELAIVFLAGRSAPRHVENPKQVPAYRYPREYGPRSPSFARATVVEADGRRRCWISGTSAVTGHASVGIGDLDAQMKVTGENLQIVLDACGVASTSEGDVERSGKAYLRRSEDLEAAQAFMRARFPDFAEQMLYLRADVCRQELLFEAELSLSAPL